MPRGAHSPRKTQSLYISGVGGGVGGGVRTASPDLVLSSAASASEIPPTSAPPTPRERHGHCGGMGAGVGRPHSLAGDSTTTHAAAYLYSCNPPYARYYANTPPPCVGVFSCKMKEGERSPSPVGATGRRASSTTDELFHSPRHAEVALRRMEAYYARGQLCDVTLVAGSRRIKAHRLVLSAASDYFAAMFTSPVLEATQEEVALRDMDSDALLTLINYCYTGTLELHEDTVEVVLSTAHHLLLTEVVEVCCDFLTKQLHPANCLGIQLFADTQGCSELHRLASKYTAEHFQEVMQHQEFVQLPPEEAAHLLASEDLNVPSEELIFQALVVWLKYDLEERTKNMADLLSLVKLPLLSPQFLTDHIETNVLFKENRECQELILEALKYHLLPERRSALQSPRTKPRKSTVGDMYVVGGMDSNKGGWRGSSTGIERYDLRTNSWTSVGTMTGRRLQFGVAVLDSKLHVVGGRDGLKTLNTVEAYDPATNTWTQLPPMSTHRHGLGVGVLEGPLYAVGGHDGWSYLNTVERWDPQARQWSYVAPMSTSRSTVGVAVLNNRLYAVGGRDGSSCLRTVECYDPHTNKWTPCAPMARRRGGVAVGVVNGFLYAVGGHDAPASNPCASRFDCVERYDPATDTWTQVACLSVGCDSAGVSLLGDRLFCVGGYDGQTYLNLVHAYDPQTNEWTQMAPLINGRAGACVVVVKKEH
ncbi:kelch-like protein 5 isoform X2 [Portunus trituberculatus]|uniref:kelch-like protein 5 isoform X2 n=1 Tax=Portunus trituberculatus TaxID=210409 RepID=UPI001E1D0D5B|nr:kelch-like protein 5 isoform X2 [Portunus trituberculatus]